MWPGSTIEAMAAVFGGTQSLHTNALDEAIALPTDFSARIARETQLFLQEETKITRVVDPWGGSYYVETLTHELAQRAWALIEEVEELGGMTKAIEAGIPKMRIEEAAAKKQARLDSGTDVLVGVNKYRLAQEDELSILEVDNEKVRTQQMTRLKKLKDQRYEGEVQEILTRITLTAKDSLEENKQRDNLLALAVEAARARATLGEISTALEKAYGRHTAKTNTITGVYSKEIKQDDSFKKAVKLADPTSGTRRS
ncbi:methylmalonyl-CoA mutase family protein [Maribacter litopenaei]|uniref:Methylmalonyl-CoA mutase family protein n=1 Tax=Maribacter litopenaei TaxID=2976127 RepID=A0ABY5Y883_9FLAO|nr:methylmalonyl-CoA mutase family protein [Maribacter litopenaei]UWX55226.1 methylmalonyl-CoA mutase family protein [Maribacter litopenaei]